MKREEKDPSHGNDRERLIVVSNRLPLTLGFKNERWTSTKSSGGLATAMDPLLHRMGGIWIGWSGDNSGRRDPNRQQELKRWQEEESCIAVDLPRNVVRGFYEGFSNQTLWFLFHCFPSLVRFDNGDWDDYVKANEKFCDVVVEHLRPGDLIWVHDYQLMLLPKLIRERVPEAKIGFFLHIPFPASDVFRILPHRKEILSGLLAADYLAFHTHQYLQNFRASLLRILGIASSMDSVTIGSRQVRLEAQPIGIAPKEFENILGGREVQGFIEKYEKRSQGKKVLLGVDRIDFSKGIPERLRSYRNFLKKNKRLRGKVVMIQVAVPSRGGILRYAQLQQEVDELIGQINGEFGQPDWSPIVYMRRNLPREELAALYAIADIALVTPLRDGLNLVSKEYVACKKNGDGVLILSEFAGASAEMGEALHVNPYDENGMVETIERALSMPIEQRRDRMSALYKRIVKNDVFSWGEQFITNLKQAVSARPLNKGSMPPRLVPEQAAAAYEKAKDRLILLDYDGTLVSYTKRAVDAIPGRQLLRLLKQLAEVEGNVVHIISGRSRTDLDTWFGGIPNIWLSAEHGAMIRSPITKEWETSYPGYSDEWKKEVLDVLDHFARRTPGSYIEEKEFSVVWHYRMADPEFGEWLANELNSTLDQLLASTQLQTMRGRKNIEVKLTWAKKSNVLDHAAHADAGFDFIFAAGDDATDEDLFNKMPPSAWTVHVGDRQSAARFSVRDHSAIVGLLETFVIPDRRVRSVQKAGAH